MLGARQRVDAHHEIGRTTGEKSDGRAVRLLVVERRFGDADGAWPAVLEEDGGQPYRLLSRRSPPPRELFGVRTEVGPRPSRTEEGEGDRQPEDEMSHGWRPLGTVSRPSSSRSRSAQLRGG